MKMKRRYYIALLLGVLSFPALAQKDSTLNRTVVVENEYNPSLMDANKINVLPRVEEPTVKKKEIEYAKSERPLTRFSASVLPVLGERPAQEEASHGLVQLGYGTHGLMLGRLHFLQEVDAQNEWNIGASFDGLNGKVQPEQGGEKWTSRSYAAELFGGYKHRFLRNELGVKLNLGTQAFNYAPYDLLPSDKQTFTTGKLEVGFESILPTDRWQYRVEASYQRFGIGHVYGLDATNAEKDQSVAENTYQLEGDLSYRFTDEQTVGLALELAERSYSKPLQAEEEGEWIEVDNTTHIGLLPYYQVRADHFRARLGAHVDIVSGFESAVKVAPEILLELPFDERYNLYTKFTGGVVTNDFRRMKELTPYGVQPYASDETYTPVDWIAGFKAGVAPGFSLQFYGGYAYHSKDLLIDPTEAMPTTFVQGKAHEVKAGISGEYLYKEWIHLNVGADYHAWSGNSDHKEWYYTKPALDLYLRADGKVKQVGWNLDYQYTSRYKGEMNAINNLALRLSYDLPEHFQLWVKGDNLLNRSYSYYWGVPALKTNVLVGAAYKF
jgi:hypothetical protein